MAGTRGEEVYLPESIELEAKEKAKFKMDVKKISKKSKEDISTRGVVYLGHIPAGFYEPQMKKFFGQFGRVTRLRLSRSKKTGRSKGYAFIEFFNQEVAKVVADTMNNYLMFMRLLKCEYIEPERLHPDTFKGCNKKFAAPKVAEVTAVRHNKTKTSEQEKRARGRQAKKLKTLKSKLTSLGIDYALDLCEEVASPSVPEVVKTPKVLKEDSSDAEVTFKTPPGTFKSSRLTTTPKAKTSSAKKKKGVKRLK